MVLSVWRNLHFVPIEMEVSKIFKILESESNRKWGRGGGKKVGLTLEMYYERKRVKKRRLPERHEQNAVFDLGYKIKEWKK